MIVLSEKQRAARIYYFRTQIFADRAQRIDYTLEDFRTMWDAATAMAAHYDPPAGPLSVAVW